MQHIEVANHIRRKCRIDVTNENKDKIFFSKKEQMIILAYITTLEVDAKVTEDRKALIKETIEELMVDG